MAVGNSLRGKDSDVDIAVRCPICGDSRSKKHSTRLHLYHKNGKDSVNCFNGDCPANSNRSVKSFLYQFFPALYDQYKRETFMDNIDSLADGTDDVFEQFKKPVSEEKDEIVEEKDVVFTQDFAPFFHPIENIPEALAYLNKRGVQYNNEKYGNWYFGYQDLKIGEKRYTVSNSIVIPLYYKNQMYGFYSRNISNKDFSTYMHDSNIGYKIFNWFNIDKTKPVYIFEGIFDAISSGLENVIALMGAKLPDSRLEELHHPVFVLDNDRTGMTNSIEYANRGYDVYIQPENILEKDMNEVRLKHPDLDIPQMIKNNIFGGISATVRINFKL